MKLTVLTLPLFIASAALAQENPNPRSIGEPIQDPFGVPTLAEAFGELRASGRHYEATFKDGRMEFLPVLGSSAPTVQSFDFTFTSASRGETTVHAEDHGTFGTDGLTASFRRTPSLTETYEVRSEGLKQSFVFERKFGESGPLVVRGQIETPLPFTGETADGGLSFVHPAWGGVELGRVVGFDATGAEVIGSMSFDGKEIEMSLPASFVDHAAWPITVDPLVGTVLSANVDPNDARAPDASTSDGGTVLLTFTRVFALNAAGIRAQRISSGGANIGSVLFVTNEPYAVNSAVGYNLQVDNWLVAYERRDSAILPADILARSVQPDGTVSSPFNVATGSSNQQQPDVGSDGRGTDNECMVVWTQQGFGLRAREVRPLSSGPAAFSSFTLTSNSGDNNPAISQNCGANGICLVAFQRGTDVYATSMTLNGTIFGSPILIATDASMPDCDGDGSIGMIVYEKPEPGNFFDGDIFARCVNLNPLVTTGPERAIDEDQDSDETEPAIAFLGPNVLLVYSDQSGTSTTNYDVRGYTLDLELCTQCSLPFGTGRSFVGRQHKSVATSRLSADTNAGSEAGMFFWLEQDGSNSANGDIYGRRFAATGSGGSLLNIAPGCGLGGTLSTFSSLSLGTELELELTGADPGATAGFLLLREPGTALFNCGICQAVIPALVLNQQIVGGEFSVSIQIPCNITLSGGRFEWQAAVLGSSQTPCTLLPGGGFSNVLRTTLGF